MKFIKVVYNDESDFILNILNEFDIKQIELYNIDDYKQKKKAIPIMTRHGTKNVPLIVFEDENLQEYAAIWSESYPDWRLELSKKLKDV